jgi:hypothetical protein
VVRDPAEPEADDLGEWGVGACERRGAASDRQDEPGRAGAACAARVAAAINSVSAASMRDASAASQNSDDRWPTALLPCFSAPYGGPPAQLTRMVGQTAARGVESLHTEPM